MVWIHADQDPKPWLQLTLALIIGEKKAFMDPGRGWPVRRGQFSEKAIQELESNWYGNSKKKSVFRSRNWKCDSGYT